MAYIWSIAMAYICTVFAQSKAYICTGYGYYIWPIKIYAWHIHGLQDQVVTKPTSESAKSKPNLHQNFYVYYTSNREPR